MSIFQKQRGGDGVSQTQIVAGNGNTVVGVNYSGSSDDLGVNVRESHYGVRNGFKAFSKDFTDLVETLKWVQDDRYPGEWLLEQTTPGDETKRRFRRIHAFSTKNLTNAFIGTEVQWEKVPTVPYLFSTHIYHEEYCTANLYYDVNDGFVYKLEHQFGDGFSKSDYVTCLDEGVLIPLCIDKNKVTDDESLWSGPKCLVFYDPEENDAFYVKDPLCIIEDDVSKPQLKKFREWFSSNWPGVVMIVASIIACAMNLTR